MMILIHLFKVTANWNTKSAISTDSRQWGCYGGDRRG